MQKKNKPHKWGKELLTKKKKTQKKLAGYLPLLWLYPACQPA
jgi:hypothetical protein